MKILKLLLALLVASNAYIAHAECTDSKTKLTRKDGRVLQWGTCFEEGHYYCTQNSYGKICLEKNQFVSVETYKDTSISPDAIIINNEEKFKEDNEKLEIDTQKAIREREEELKKIEELANKEDELRRKTEEEQKRQEESEKQRIKERDRKREEDIKKIHCYENCIDSFSRIMTNSLEKFSPNSSYVKHCDNMCGTELGGSVFP